jgi:hypothetical protein
MSAQATDVILTDTTNEEDGYLVMYNRGIRNDNGTALFMSRGDSSLVVIDEGTPGS